MSAETGRGAIPDGLRRRDWEPLFAEPWQAECMALAARLVELGRLSAAAWSEALGREIRRGAAAGEPDTAASYYAAALRALERLAVANGMVEEGELAARKRDWIEAYETTPHGKPVQLPGDTKR